MSALGFYTMFPISQSPHKSNPSCSNTQVTDIWHRYSEFSIIQPLWPSPPLYFITNSVVSLNESMWIRQCTQDGAVELSLRERLLCRLQVKQVFCCPGRCKNMGSWTPRLLQAWLLKSSTGLFYFSGMQSILSVPSVMYGIMTLLPDLALYSRFVI